MTDIIPLLYSVGYLTIKDFDDDCDLYRIDIPNKDVHSAIKILATQV